MAMPRPSDEPSTDDEGPLPMQETTPEIQGHRSRPFKVEAHINLPTFDGTINAEKLDTWLAQLETYFTLYGYYSMEKATFARLKLTSHALAWWNSYLATHGAEAT